MQIPVCPRCRSLLTDDIIEYLEPQRDEGVKIYTFDAFVCGCGYMEQIEIVPEVIAQQGEDRLLLLYRDEQARILDVRDSVLWPPMHVESLLGRGYWEEYDGSHDIASLLKDVRDSNAYDVKSPSFFQISSSSNSLDISFFTWLLSWSLKNYEKMESNLHKAALHLVSEIFISHGIPLPIIHSIDVKHMFNRFELTVIINNQYVLLINNHDETKEQNDYKNIESISPDLISLPVFYGNKNLKSYRSLELITIDYTKMISILSEGKGVNNHIYIDYLNHLQSSILRE